MKRKTLLTILMCSMLLQGLPVTSTAAAAAEINMNIEEIPKEDVDDPGYFRLSEKASESRAEGGDTGMQLFSRSGNSPFAVGNYVHNDAFDSSTVVHGIDVSKYQGNIDWKAAKAAGVDYAFIRVAYRGYGDSGNIADDTYYKQNIEGALAAGVPVGVYFFSQAITEKEAVEEAQYILNKIKGYNVTLPVVMDFEFAGTGVGRLYNAGLDKAQMTEICLAFCETVKAAGYEPMLYANKVMLTNYLNASQISSQYDIWLAQYTSEATYAGDYTFWQYTSSGTVDGISGKVDCNFWYQGTENGGNNGEENEGEEVTGISLSASNATLTAGTTKTLNAVCTGTAAAENVTWMSSNPAAAYVDSNGKVYAVSAGTTTITAITSESALTAACAVTVKEPLTEYTITGLSNKIYTGKAITPGIKVISAKETIVQASAKEYIEVKAGAGINYETVTMLSPDTAVMVTGITLVGETQWYAVTTSTELGSYRGYVQASQCNGVSGYRTLTEGSDYAVVYSDNMEIGKASVTVTGKGNYNSIITKQFCITPKKTTRFQSTKQTTTQITLEWAKVDQADGYVIYRSDSKNGTYKRVKTINKNTTLKWTNTGLPTSTQYYYKIRTFKRAGGKTLYSTYSGVRSVYTKTSYTRTITAKSATKLRSGGGTGFSAVTSVKKDANLTCIAVTKDTNGKTWYRVRYVNNGRTYSGYVPGTDLTVTKTGKVTASNLNIRKNASITAAAVLKLDKGHMVTISKSVKDTTGSKWYKIETQKSNRTYTGYVSASYIKLYKF